MVIGSGPFIGTWHIDPLISLDLELQRANLRGVIERLSVGAGMVPQDQDGSPSGSALTPHRAVLIGQLVVNLPVVCVIGLGFFLAYLLKGPAWAPLGLFVGIIPAWLWWSFMVPRWREWAKRQGADEIETQLIGERSGLVWPQGSIFEKTEFHSRKRTAVESNVKAGSEEARVLEEARGFAVRWRRRTIILGVTLLVNIASIVPFLAGHSLHGHFEMVGKPLLLLSMCLLPMFVVSAAQTYNFWVYQKDCEMLYRVGNAKSR
jgi:hypothetical protein